MTERSDGPFDVLPASVFHGTSAEKWRQALNGGGRRSELYLARSLATAAKYALEWAECGEAPLIIRFELDDLKASGLELHPNWETVEAENLWKPGSATEATINWEKCLRVYGSFCVAGDVDAVKLLGKEVALPESAPGNGAPSP